MAERNPVCEKHIVVNCHVCFHWNKIGWGRKRPYPGELIERPSRSEATSE